MAILGLIAAQENVSRLADGATINVRGLRDGTLVSLPWYQALVFEGRVFHAQAGTVTTGIAGHASADADQPEFAVRVPTAGLEVMPLRLYAGAQSFETTLGIHSVMWAVSNIDVANGTSTAYTGDTAAADGLANNMRIDKPRASSCLVRHTYSANGTDPLTAGNFLELGREAGNFDSDVATSGIKGLSLTVSAQSQIMPVIADIGCIVGYGEGGTTANFFFLAEWAEFSGGDLT